MIIKKSPVLSIICEIILLIKFPAIAYLIPVLGTVCTLYSKLAREKNSCVVRQKE